MHVETINVIIAKKGSAVTNNISSIGEGNQGVNVVQGSTGTTQANTVKVSSESVAEAKAAVDSYKRELTAAEGIPPGVAENAIKKLEAEEAELEKEAPDYHKYITGTGAVMSSVNTLFGNALLVKAAAAFSAVASGL